MIFDLVIFLNYSTRIRIEQVKKKIFLETHANENQNYFCKNNACKINRVYKI